MGILLAFAPFVAFALVDHLVGSIAGLAAGAVVAIALIARELVAGRRAKLLEIGTTFLFVGLAAYAAIANPTWSIVQVRLRVDAGLLLIVVLTLLIRQPFTLQYARESVRPELWNSPTFLRTNIIITSVWALAFLLLVAADLVFVYEPQIPPRLGIILTVIALVGAIKFSNWYPTTVRHPN